MILFYCITDQVQVSSLCIPLAIRPSMHFLHLPPIFIDNGAEILKDLWTLDRGEAPVESRKAEVSFIYSIIR